MSRSSTGSRRRGRSGWLVPLGVFVVVAAISAVILGSVRLGPAASLFGESPAPTDSNEAVAVTIGQTSFHIPANYVLYASARRGGEMRELEMIALLPDLQGYSLDLAQEFAKTGPDSRVLNFTVREERRPPSDEERLEQTYFPWLVSTRGGSGPHGLTRYEFGDGAPAELSDKELLAGPTAGGQAIIVCAREDANVEAPSCEGDAQISEDLALSYRFQRAQLEHWRDIDSALRAITGAFMDVR